MSLRKIWPAPVSDQDSTPRRVRDPRDRLPLTIEGKEVEWSIFWERRRADGDILLSEPVAAGHAKGKGPGNRTGEEA